MIQKKSRQWYVEVLDQIVRIAKHLYNSEKKSNQQISSVCDTCAFAHTDPMPHPSSIYVKILARKQMLVPTLTHPKGIRVSRFLEAKKSGYVLFETAAHSRILVPTLTHP